MDFKIENMKQGDSAVITGYAQGSQNYRTKLLTMGLTKGCSIKLLKVAPLGDPVELEIRGYSLSLRKKEADVLILRKDS